ncbi:MULTISPECIES: DNA cytosine methyltransferase [unclassified Desulfovibrio]|uniref:DNA cytosine methyltransferase n=1 Tax=unclassified Desulfovibrio TaxID=2593640 RepID=UPI000F5F8172|nr:MULTISPECIES: DNA (cytosine-5-)-methyltransferase [unclassified Desulfovibrio]RRD69810.1 DNA cytosine methyltransferase [Desulfovibrio sp. OH1209_COT-279]RRD86421.1 DNA cytosine methyltransferase [Desulfovibrio sp. OH1186_COT-070]
MRVIDLFAGPGGLAEGFSSVEDINGNRAFKIALSIEKETAPFNTLRLRAFFRQFPLHQAPEAYYDFLRGTLSHEKFMTQFPEEASRAEQETWQATLGDTAHELVDQRIIAALAGESDWLLIGGPPCQAYSLVGRARNQWTPDHTPDEEHPYYYLYKEYIRVVEQHAPTAFVMENVPGLFSVIGKEGPLIEHILHRLQNPGNGVRYHLYSMSKGAWDWGQSPREFLVRAERFGLPQARHRIIIFGVRADVPGIEFSPLEPRNGLALKEVIGGLPPVRGGFSKEQDCLEAWQKHLDAVLSQPWFQWLEDQQPQAAMLMRQSIATICGRKLDRGGEFVSCSPDSPALADWYTDPRIGGQCHHATRGHLASDLWRYFFSACMTRVLGRSPRLEEYPSELLPAHKNALAGKFNDRFRVQYADTPAKTVTSHISQDGHYFIHYDPTQCRSLTVREAARIQTFPDNYFFCGGRTSQFEQVGNAVPPYLAYLIARHVSEVVK